MAPGDPLAQGEPEDGGVHQGLSSRSPARERGMVCSSKTLRALGEERELPLLHLQPRLQRAHDRGHGGQLVVRILSGEAPG